jgi:SHS family lactate transporter-like MFS transporter
MLTNQYNFSANAITVTQVVANLGAITGGTIVGYCSQIFGRRFSIIIISIVGGALLYPYTFTSSKAVIAAAFFEQFCVQGAWGVIPIRESSSPPNSFPSELISVRSYGTVPGLFPYLRGWHCLPAWQPCLLSFLHY